MQTGGAIVLRELREDDIPAIDALITTVFERPGHPQAPPSAAPRGEIRYLAERDGRIVGFAAARSYGKVAYIGPMAVHPGSRRLGIASDLLQKLIANLESNGCRTLLLDATELGMPLYERFGFVDLDGCQIYERGANECCVIGSVSVDPDALVRAIAIDRRIMGCDRSAVLKAFGREPGAWLAVQNDGFVLTRGRVLGPWVADSRSAAHELFEAAIAASPGVDRIFIPHVNDDAPSIVVSAGFRCSRTLRHMGRGKSSPMQRARIFGQGSLAHG
ncbi:MAG: GNAT family N-acetyltransferase [Candidatus Baltobacteraceae bacterium]